MHKCCFPLVCLAWTLASFTAAAPLASIELDAGSHERQDALVAVELPAGVSPTTNRAKLEEDGREFLAETIPSSGILLVPLAGRTAAGTKRIIRVKAWEKLDADSSAKEEDGQFRLRHRGKPILNFHVAPDPAPPGNKANFARSGFIHPLFSPLGDELTGKRPPDHLHHMGLWHAWTNTLFDGRKTDFWNLGDETGTFRLKAIRWSHVGETWTGLNAAQEQVALLGEGKEVRVLDDDLRLIAWTNGQGHFLDYDFTQRCATDKPLELPAYRYGGGIAYRAPESWRKHNSDYLTSEGKTRVDGHQTRARWVTMHGETANGPAGVAIFCHPANHDAPQRIRVWGDDAEGKIFFNYVPIQETAWKLEPGQVYPARYRVFTYQGKPDKDLLDRLWQDYAEPATGRVLIP